MNNKGFGLQETLAFIGIFLFMLVVSSILLNAKIGKNLYNDEPPVEKVEEPNEDIKPTRVEIPKEYLKLENKLKEASRKYSFDKQDNVIISLKRLQESNLIGKIVDPNDSTIICNGYVLYNSDSNTYTPYISCPGMYITKSYNSELLEN